MTLAGRPADGRGERAQARLELVGGGGEAVAAHALELVFERGAADDRVRRQPRQPPGGISAAPKARKTLPLAVQW